MPLTKEELRIRIERDYIYHALKSDQPERYKQIREKAREFTLLILELTPVSREQSTALTIWNSLLLKPTQR